MLFTTTNVEVLVAVCPKFKFTNAVVPETVNDSILPEVLTVVNSAKAPSIVAKANLPAKDTETNSGAFPRAKVEAEEEVPVTDKLVKAPVAPALNAVACPFNVNDSSEAK